MYRTYLLSQPGVLHLYGRLPVWIRRCRARLEDCLECKPQRSRLEIVNTYVGECLIAPVNHALVRLLPGVRADMDGQCTSLDETLIAYVLPGALVRPFVCVDAEMTLEVRLSIETLSRRSVRTRLAFHPRRQDNRHQLKLFKQKASDVPWDSGCPGRWHPNRRRTAVLRPTRRSVAPTSLAPDSSSPGGLWRRRAKPSAWWMVVVVGLWWKAGK